MILVGNIDESVRGENTPLAFGLACVFAYGSEWSWVELAWKKVIEDKNRDLLEAGRKPIKRLHAVDLINFAEDFEDWDGTERAEFISNISSEYSCDTKSTEIVK